MTNEKINIKAFLWLKAKAFTWALIKFVSLNLFRLSLVIIGYAFHIVHVLSEWGIKLTAFIGRSYGVTFNNIVLHDIVASDQIEDDQFQQKFTKDDISGLAGEVDPDATIKDIERDLGISYRQARKIKMAAKNSPTIRNFTVAQLSA